ncbi:transposase family protein [Micromonospora sp. NPDC005163]
MAEAAACPECGQPARRVHAYHLRRLADFPIAGRGVIVELRVRRMSDPRLPAADLPGTVARDGVAAYPAVDRVDRGHRGSAGWSRWRGGAVPVGGQRLAHHGAAVADGTADPLGAGSGGAERGRLRATARAPLRDPANRCGHPPPGRRTARLQGRHPGRVVARASRGRDGSPGRISRRVLRQTCRASWLWARSAHPPSRGWSPRWARVSSLRSAAPRRRQGGRGWRGPTAARASYRRCPRTRGPSSGRHRGF